MDQYKLVPLIERQDLNGKCIELLNEEWPRSYAARENSQRKSCRASPPMSFVLMEVSSGRLVGHARVCLLPNRPKGCWIESVIVSRSERGKGIGKLLMQFLEDACRDFSFTEAYLSTEDKIEFYRRCGYSECEPILHSTAATSVFPVFSHLNSSSDVVSSAPSLERSSVVANVAISLAPPPPPPVCNKSSFKPIGTVGHQYMNKNL